MRKMKRNKSIRVFLGILLTAFLLIPSGLSIKAEDLSEPPEEAPPAAVLEEASVEEALVVEEEKEMLPVEETEPAAELPQEEMEEQLPEEVVKEEETLPPVEAQEPPPPSEEKEQVELPIEEVPVEESKEDLPEEKTPAPVLEKTLDLSTYHGDLGALNFMQYMEWMKYFCMGLDLPDDGSHPLGFLSGIVELLGIDPLEMLNENLKMLTIKKHWYDGEDPLRPHYVVATLLANGEPAAYLPLLKGTGYELQLYLPSKDQDGNAITYTVEEEVPHGYIGIVEKDGNTFHLYNHKAMMLSVEKIWMEDVEEIRPASITYEVLANGAVYGEERMLSEEENWKEAFLVPQYDEEGEISYSLKEEPLEGYVTTYEEGMPVDAARTMEGEEDCEHYKTLSMKIVNTFTNEKEITVKKVWVDESLEMRPETLEIMLHQDGEHYETLMMAGPDWEEKRTVPVYDMETFEKHLYEVMEEEVPEGYEASVEGMTITNKWIGIIEYVTISGEKTWMDNGEDRPESITVHLMDGDRTVDTKTVKEVEGSWTYSFKAPKYDSEENPISYTVKEEPVPGYETLQGEGYDLINRRAELIDISGEKTWDDLRGRPASITVALYRGEEKMEEKTVTKNEEDKWLYTFEDVPGFDDMGMPYSYSVKENYLMGYDVEYSGYNIKNIQQRATLRILKVNDINQPLSGAVFEVRTSQGEVLGTLTTGEDGTATMMLPLGIYRVVEIKAPAGYELGNINRMVILFNKNQTVTTEIVNEFGEIEDVDPLPLPEDDDTNGLPQTGEASSSAFYVLGLFSLMVGSQALRRRKER